MYVVYQKRGRPLLGLDQYIPPRVYCKPMKSSLVLLASLALTIVGAFIILRPGNHPVSVPSAGPVTAVAAESSSVTSSTLAYPVVGIVRADKEVTVLARTAGTVRYVGRHEGDTAATGDVLVVAENPVVAAEYTRQGLASALSVAAARRDELASAGGAGASSLAYAGSEARDAAQSEAETARLSEASELLSVTLTGTAAALAPILRFIEENKSQFPAEALQLYESVVIDLYGRETNFFSVGGISPSRDEAGLLTAVSLGTASSTDKEAVARELSLTLGRLTKAFVLAEEDFLDRTNLASDDPRFVAYNGARTALATLTGSVTGALAAVHNAADSAAVGTVGRLTTTDQAALLAKTSAADVVLATLMQDLTEELGEAQAAVVAAELGLGIEVAPFSGTVTQVFVEEGQHVMPGTPLLSYVSTAEQEVEVTVAPALRSYLVVGAPLVIDGQVVGVVDRLAPDAALGGVPVFIRLTTPFPLGASLRGLLELPVEATRISRRELFFAASGPYVVDALGESVSVRIVFDAGDTLYIEPVQKLVLPLTEATGIRL